MRRDPDGVAYIDDLYLDVTALCEVQPDGRWQVTRIEVIDIDELEAALSAQQFGPVEVVRQYLAQFPQTPLLV